MVRCSAGDTDQAADRRAVDDGAASALTHLAQFVFHAAPNAPKIDRIHAVKLFAARIGSFHCGALHAGIVERSIQLSEGGDGLLNHRCHLTVVRYVAADGECLVARCDQVIGCSTHRFLMLARQRHRRARLGEGFRGRQTYARPGAGNECDFVLKRQIHDELSLSQFAFDPAWYCSSLTFSIHSTTLPLSCS